MSRLGMDIDVVESVGKGLKQQGRQIRSIVQVVDPRVNQIGGAWWGRRGLTFVSDWRLVHRAALLRLAEAVEGLGASAHNNVESQRSISGTLGHEAGANQSMADAGGKGFAPHSWRDDLALAKAAYGGTVPGYEPVSDAILKKMGLDRGALHDEASGFDAEILVDANGKYILAFRGTDAWYEGSFLKDGDISRDAKADGDGALYLSRQVDKAALMSKAMVDYAGKENVRAVGESLGGRHAAIAAAVTGIDAVTFNAAGVSNAELTYAMELRGDHVSLGGYVGSFVGLGEVAAERQRLSGQILNHVTSTDPLTLLQVGTVLPDALGRIQVHEGPINPVASHKFEST